MSFAEVFAEEAVGIGYSNHIYINSQTGKLTVGERQFQLSQDDAALAALLIVRSTVAQISFINNSGYVSKSDVAEQFGIHAFTSMQDSLKQFDVANDGGNGSYYEDGVKGNDLFIECDGGYRFNTELVALLKEGHVLSDEQLWSISYQPQGYKLPHCCR